MRSPELDLKHFVYSLLDVAVLLAGRRLKMHDDLVLRQEGLGSTQVFSSFDPIGVERGIGNSSIPFRSFS
jgi:hypothetical protein